jgi:hypothetical protein
MEMATMKELNEGLSEALRADMAKTNAGDQRPRREVQPVAPSAEARFAPRNIAGGFNGLSDDLGRRIRDGRNMMRILDAQRPQLEAAEAEFAASYQRLAKIVPIAQDAGKVLTEMLATTKSGAITEDLGPQFTRNLRALDELESVAEALTVNLLQVRSSWEQYAKSIIRAQKMRDSGFSEPA